MQNLLSIPTLWHGTSPLGKASIALAWLDCAEEPSSRDASACCYSTLKDFWVFAVVEPIRKLVQVKREIFAADIVVCPDDAPLEQAPKRIEIVGVYFPMHVLTAGVMHSLVTIAKSMKIVVTLPFIRGNQIHLVTNRLGDKLIQRLFGCAFDDPANYTALAGDCPDNSSLSAATSDVAFLVPVAILVLAAAATKNTSLDKISH